MVPSPSGLGKIFARVSLPHLLIDFCASILANIGDRIGKNPPFFRISGVDGKTEDVDRENCKILVTGVWNGDFR